MINNHLNGFMWVGMTEAWSSLVGSQEHPAVFLETVLFLNIIFKE